jgi:hypothetical protein
VLPFDFGAKLANWPRLWDRGIRTSSSDTSASVAIRQCGFGRAIDSFPGEGTSVFSATEGDCGIPQFFCEMKNSRKFASANRYQSRYIQ